MLARQHRFFGFGSVRPVLKSGVSARQGLFTVRMLRRHCSPSPEPCSSRAAVVVSRKTAKSAVLRNRIRRRCYAGLEAQGDSFADRPVDLAIIVHDARLAEWSSAELSRELTKTLQAALAKLR